MFSFFFLRETLLWVCKGQSRPGFSINFSIGLPRSSREGGIKFVIQLGMAVIALGTFNSLTLGLPRCGIRSVDWRQC